MAQRDYRSDAYRQALLNELDPYTGLPGRQTQGGGTYTMPAPDWSGGGPEDLMAAYERRNEGAGGVGRGALGGAATGATIGSAVPVLGTAAGAVIGGIAGGIGGAFTKNAETAMTDFADRDARDAIGKAYQQYLGRPASVGELDDQLRAQGYRADQGHKWVGEDGLRAVLSSIQRSPEAGLYQQTGVPVTARAQAAGTAAGGSASTSLGNPASTAPAGGQFTGGSGALVDPYALPNEADLEGLLANAQRYTGYDPSTGRIGVAGGGLGGYAGAGFDFAQDAGNRDIGKSAKYAFSYLSEQAAAAGAPMPRTKADAEAWFTQYIAPGLQQLGYEIGWVQGDKAQIRTREGWDVIDFVGGADGDNPMLTWQSEVLAPGGGPMAGASGSGMGGSPVSGADLTSSALFERLLEEAQAIASGRQSGSSSLDTRALLDLMVRP